MNRPWLTLPATLAVAIAMAGCTPQAMQVAATALSVVGTINDAGKPSTGGSAAPKPAAPGAKASAKPSARPSAKPSAAASADAAPADDGDGEATGAAGEADGEATRPIRPQGSPPPAGTAGGGRDCDFAFAAADGNRDREVSLNEFLRHEGTEGDDDTTYLESAYDKYDANQDGALTDDEYCPLEAEEEEDENDGQEDEEDEI